MVTWRLYFLIWRIIFRMDLQLRSMDEESVLTQSATSRKTSPGAWLGSITRQRGKAGMVRQVARLIASGGVSLFRYLIESGLFSGQGVVILSRHDRATFGTVDLRRATTLITLRRLNMVKHLEMFLSSLSRILPPGTNFVGCFSPVKRETAVAERHGREDVLDGRPSIHGSEGFRSLNSRMVSEMLERYGLSLISMTEMSGVTYFHSRKIAGFPVMTA
jgi:hypothetical protein